MARGGDHDERLRLDGASNSRQLTQRTRHLMRHLVDVAGPRRSTIPRKWMEERGEEARRKRSPRQPRRTRRWPQPLGLARDDRGQTPERSIPTVLQLHFQPPSPIVSQVSSSSTLLVCSSPSPYSSSSSSSNN